MSEFNIGTGEEQPINRTGLSNVQVAGNDVQGVLVGVDNSGKKPQLVKADAASGTAIPAVGVLLPQEVFPDDPYADFGTHDLTEELAQMRAERDVTEVGDRATVIRYGVEMVNDGTDLGLTPGEPVYLGEGGGLTQTKPSNTGDLVQVVGVALTPENYGEAEGIGENATGGRERVLLDVNAEYKTV